MCDVCGHYLVYSMAEKSEILSIVGLFFCSLSSYRVTPKQTLYNMSEQIAGWLQGCASPGKN